MKRIYIAGAYSSDNVIGVLDNIRKGIRASVEIMLMGYAPFCPWLDYQFQLMLKDNEILTVQDYYNYSLAWLKVSDALLVLPGYEKSNGTLKEIEFAIQNNIPIFFNRKSLQKYI